MAPSWPFRKSAACIIDTNGASPEDPSRRRLRTHQQLLSTAGHRPPARLHASVGPKRRAATVAPRLSSRVLQPRGESTTATVHLTEHACAWLSDHARKAGCRGQIEFLVGTIGSSGRIRTYNPP